MMSSYTTPTCPAHKKRGVFLYSLIAVFALLSASLCSCEDDETFTTSGNSILSFSTDTLKFDTVFSTIGSSTKRLKVYNRNSKALRISSVHLSSQGKSGFRINVDGQYGPVVSDVEILDKDSMFIFAEITANVQNSDFPKTITDTINFVLESGVRQSVIVEAQAQDAILLRGLTVEGEMSLSEQKPYIIYDSIYVAPQGNLHITKGVTLCFHKNASMLVHGSVSCEGTLEAPVTMRCDRTDKLFPYLPYDRTDAQWGGVRIFPESGDCSFNYTDIHGGSYGIVCDSTLFGSKKLTVTNSIISNVSGDALSLHNMKATVSNSEISNAGGNCVTVIGGDVEFTHCTIAQFYPWSGQNGNGLLATNYSGAAPVPLLKAGFKNCVISGKAADEVYLSSLKDSDAQFEFSFLNCLLLTPVPEEKDMVHFTDCVFESEDKPAYRGTNFRLINNDYFIYDFRLTKESPARQIGNSSYASGIPTDRLGVSRKEAAHPDAGCYQFVTEDEESTY